MSVSSTGREILAVMCHGKLKMGGSGASSSIKMSVILEILELTLLEKGGSLYRRMRLHGQGELCRPPPPEKKQTKNSGKMREEFVQIRAKFG